jgi:stringent starvation protein B
MGIAEMTSNKPYLLRALHEWILDNGLTPHIIVDVQADGVDAPPQAIQDGKLVLNISPRATKGLEIGNDSIIFEARFAGAAHRIYLPIESVMAIYARENGQGMMFAREKDAGSEQPTDDAKQGGPHLKLIK